MHMKDLRDLRQDKKIKAVYIARELGVSRAAVYYWEDGTYSPSYDKITKLAVLYGCSIEDINTAIMITKKHAIEREANSNA